VEVSAFKKWGDIKEVVDEGLVSTSDIDLIIKEVTGRKKAEGPLTLSEFKVKEITTYEALNESFL
jgi:hypothetical protein